MNLLVKIAYRNIWRNKRRTAFCFTAVGIAVFFIVVYSSMINGMTKSINDLVQVFDLGHVRVVSQTYEEEKEFLPVQYPVSNGQNWRETAKIIEEMPEVRAVFPRIATVATLRESTKKHAILWGLNIKEETEANVFNFTNKNNGLIEGRYPASSADGGHGAVLNECAIGHVFAEKSGLKIGDRIPLKTVSAQFSDKIWSPVIVGIFNYDYIKFDENYILVDFERLQNLLVLDGGTQQLIVFAQDESKSGAVAAKLQELFADTDDLVTEWTEDYWVAVMKSVMPLYTIIFMIFLIVASFLIINTVIMIIHERIKEIGMMGCLGMTRKEIVTVFFFESLFLAAFGAFAGVIVGGITATIFAHYPIRLGDLYGNTFSEMPLSNAIFFQFSFFTLFQAWLMGVVIASVFTLLPSLKSAFVEPVEALRR